MFNSAHRGAVVIGDSGAEGGGSNIAKIGLNFFVALDHIGTHKNDPGAFCGWMERKCSW